MKGYVHQDLVEGPVQEGGVHGDDGMHASPGQPGSGDDGVLFGDAHVEDPVRESRQRTCRAP